MMKAFGLMLAIALCGCSSPGEKAEREFEIVAKTGTSAERCEALRKVTAAWLTEQNQEKYQRRKLSQDIQCQEAQLDRVAGHP